jgi:hypothetical protein
MILKTSENRAQVLSYLESIGENTFRDDIIIPLFSSQGFQVYRINSHGPGEHGKDIIFSRYVPLFLEHEFIVVQAKAQRVASANVAECTQQVERALKTAFPSRSGNADLLPHYVVFMNARTHSNEAFAEFPEMVNNIHVKILSQENVCELIMQTGVAPHRLLKQLSTSTPDNQSAEDKLVCDTILGGNPAQIDALLNHRLKFVKDMISSRTKDLVIDYIYDRWQMDRSWAGTVEPMKWFDTYFNFFTDRHSEYLLTVFEELMSSTPSYDALPFAKSMVNKIKPDLLAPIEDKFVKFAAHRAVSYPRDNRDILLQKLRALVDSGLLKSKANVSLAKKVLQLEECEKMRGGHGTKKLEHEILSIIWPDRDRNRSG